MSIAVPKAGMRAVQSPDHFENPLKCTVTHVLGMLCTVEYDPDQALDGPAPTKINCHYLDELDPPT